MLPMFDKWFNHDIDKVLAEQCLLQAEKQNRFLVEEARIQRGL
jgi:hypothetical protein